MILSDQTIRQMLSEHSLVISPLTPEQIQPASVDVRLGNTFSVVEGRSSRCWTDQDKALDKLQESGIDRAIIYDSVPKSLAQLEKVLGVAKFKELVGEYVTKPMGKPTLAPENDSRREFNSAAADFAGVAQS